MKQRFLAFDIETAKLLPEALPEHSRPTLSWAISTTAIPDGA